MDNIKLLTVILVVVLGIMAMLFVILGIVYVTSRMKKNKASSNIANSEEKTVGKVTGKTKKFKEYKVDSIMNFLEFDTVVDNMISQKDGNRYVMVVECQGVNYDLMSQAEKNSVEESFVQFLNTLRYPVQIYTQTRTINLENSIKGYKEKVDETKTELEKYELRYDEMRRSGKYSEEQLAKAYFELTKRRNLYEYGKDIIFNTERMSMNKNVLNKKYYVVIPYFVEELGDNKYDKLEQRNYAFSELYTRAQAIMRTLSACGINSKVLSSDELVELLYMAYNRDEAEVYGIDKAIKAGYNELYTTAPDIIEKQMKALDAEIEQEAIEKARRNVNEARNEKQRALMQKRIEKELLIDELAKKIIEENSDSVGKDIAKKAVEKIDKKKKEGGTKDNAKQEKTKRTRKPRTA